MELRRSSRLRAKRAELGESMPAGSGAVDALPDEVLALVFGMLTNGRTLLDVLPLVCKRWCHVARCAASWAGVELTVSLYQVAEDTRILLHAPAAKSLRITESWSQFYSRVRSALRRSRVVISGTVLILEEGWAAAREPNVALTGPTESCIACFLARQRNLRELHLYLGRGDEVAQILLVVATLRRLQRVLFVEGPGAPYGGELAGGLPELRELRLHGKNSDLKPVHGLVGDLVRGARALRVLEVDMPLGSDRDACAALRCVEHVKVNVFAVPDDDVTSAVASVREACALVKQMETPGVLKTAEVTMCREEHARFSRAVRVQCRRVGDAFSLKMPQVKLQVNVPGPKCDICGCIRGCPGRYDWPLSDDSESDEEDDEEDDEEYGFGFGFGYAMCYDDGDGCNCHSCQGGCSDEEDDSDLEGAW